jgi:hypothetical protein
MTIQLTIKEAKGALVETMKAGLVPMLHGSPAMGKSSIVHQIAEEYNLELIDLRLSQCDPTDLLGFPSIDKETGKASYMPMDTFPLEGDPLPQGKNGWLLFCDEANAADRSTQKAAYKLLLDKMVGQRKLNPNVAVMAAGNLATDNAIVEEMGTALQSRLIHIEVVASHKNWVEWANENAIDFKIVSFINFKPTLLYNFDPNHSDKTFASPRTWEFADKLFKQADENSPLMLPLLAGALGEGVAREFLAFTKIYGRIPTIEQVISAPEVLPVPTDMGVLYAMTGLLGYNLNKENVQQLLKFIKRMPTEFQLITLRTCVRLDLTMLGDVHMQEWIDESKMDLS